MAVFTESDLITLLRIQNPWWSGKMLSSDRDKPFRRGEYYLCSRAFHHSLRRFPVLTGPRRVGKSTILYQMISDLLRSGANPIRILYMSLDTVALEEAGILKLLMLYRSQISQDETFYLFIDEVQKDDDWTSALKFIYDSFPAVRAAATGSASFRIEKQYHETGEGRLRLIRVPTLSFYEYNLLRGHELPLPNIQDVFQLHQAPLSEQSAVMNTIAGIEPELNRYLRIGGFPEYISVSPQDEGYAVSLIEENVINKAIFTDLAKTEKTNPTQLKRVFAYLCYVTSSIINIEEICRELTGISNATVAKYIEILESAGLIYCAHQMDQTGKKILKTRDKIHIADSGIRGAIVSGLYAPDDPVQMGYLLESVAFKHTVDYCRCADPRLRVGYMIHSGKGNEADIVIADRTEIKQLAEVKFRKQSSIRSTDLILALSREDRPGYIITKSSSDYGSEKRKEGSLYRIPAAAYLYLLGQMQYFASKQTTSVR